MKKVTYTLLFILLSFTCNAQRFVEVAQWQVVLANDYKVFGIAPDLATAEANILKFKTAHKSKKFAITTSDIRYATIALGKQGQDPYHRFRLMAKNDYKILTSEDQIALRIIKDKGLNSGVTYYKNVNKVSRDFSYTKLFELTKYYTPYMINDDYQATARIVRR